MYIIPQGRTQDFCLDMDFIHAKDLQKNSVSQYAVRVSIPKTEIRRGDTYEPTVGPPPLHWFLSFFRQDRFNLLQNKHYRQQETKAATGSAMVKVESTI